MQYHELEHAAKCYEKVYTHYLAFLTALKGSVSTNAGCKWGKDTCDSQPLRFFGRKLELTFRYDVNAEMGIISLSEVVQDERPKLKMNAGIDALGNIKIPGQTDYSYTRDMELVVARMFGDILGLQREVLEEPEAEERNPFKEE